MLAEKHVIFSEQRFCLIASPFRLLPLSYTTSPRHRVPNIDAAQYYNYCRHLWRLCYQLCELDVTPSTTFK